MGLATSQPQSSNQITITGEKSAQKRRFKISITLSDPDDLKVREGESIGVGQIVADRTRDRARLEAQREQIKIQLARLSIPIPKPATPQTVGEIAPLPAASFTGELAEIDKQKIEAERLERSRNNQQRKLDMLGSLAEGELPPSSIPHETEMLAQREKELNLAEAEITLAEAKLKDAQKAREHAEYVHSLELSKRNLQIQQGQLEHGRQIQEFERQERDRVYQVAQLTAQLQNLDNQLAQLAAVRSPYSGKIQRIKFGEQRDQNLSVELTLLTDDGTSRPRSATPGTKTTTSGTEIQPTPSTTTQQ